MTDSGSGIYTLPNGYQAVTGQTVLASQHNPPLEDIAAALNRRHFSDGRKPFLGDQNLNGYKMTNAANGVAAQDLVTMSQVAALVAAVQGFVTGDLKNATGTQAQAGWVVANGQALARATYPDLWAFAQASGNLAATQGGKTKGQYGPGDGSTTFTVPDLTDEFVRGLASGRTIGSTQADEIKAHNHSGTAVAAGAHAHNYVGSGGNTTRDSGSAQPVPTGVTTQTTTTAPDHTHTLSINNTGGAETRPRNIAYPYLIKT